MRLLCVSRTYLHPPRCSWDSASECKPCRRRLGRELPRHTHGVRQSLAPSTCSKSSLWTCCAPWYFVCEFWEPSFVCYERAVSILSTTTCHMIDLLVCITVLRLERPDKKKNGFGTAGEHMLYTTLRRRYTHVAVSSRVT